MSLKLTKVEAGTYQTEDGRYNVEKSGHYTYCLGPHPVRVPREAREEIRAAIGDSDKEFDARRKWGGDFTSAVRHGEKGYQCPGDEEHYREHWIVWDNETNDYARAHGSDGDDFETKTEAVGWLVKYAYGDPYAEMRETMQNAV